MLKKATVVSGGTMTISGLPGHSLYYVMVRTEGGEVRVRKGVYVE